MTAETPFEDDRGPVPPPDADELVVDIEGYEGPIDVLLNLAREQKVDLTRISILALADQYLAFIARARGIRLEIAADYLVMAAWLAFLKSRLLLPQREEGLEEPSAAEMAAALRFQLQRLEAMQEAGARLMARAQLGRDIFPRGAPDGIRVIKRPVYDLSLYELLRAYGEHKTRARPTALHIPPTELYTMQVAIERLTSMLGRIPDWTTLYSFLPPGHEGSLFGRSAKASMLSAGLELARNGRVQIRQDRAFGPIYVRRAPDNAPNLTPVATTPRDDRPDE